MDVATMEPMLPEQAVRALEDPALELVAEANRLAGRVHPIMQESIGTLVRSMNCYYSNLIEGHDTHPRDIDRALADDFAAEPRRRALQQEAVAHIHVQQLIDEGRDPPVWPASAAYVRWLHREFCAKMPETLLWVENPDTGGVIWHYDGENWSNVDLSGVRECAGRIVASTHKDNPRTKRRLGRGRTCESHGEQNGAGQSSDGGTHGQ